MRHFALSTIITLLLFTPAWAKALPQVVTEGDDSLYFLEATSAYGAGNQEVFLMYAETVNYTGWARTWGTSVSEYPKGLAVDFAGNAIVCGDFGMVPQETYAAQGGFVLKFSTAGNLVWAKELVWSYHVVLLEAVTTDASSNIYTTGIAWDYADFPEPDGLYPVEGFVFTVKLDPNGEVLWAKRWNADSRDWNRGYDVLTDGNEVVVLAEHSSRDTSSDGFSDKFVHMLWYNAASGDLAASQSWGIPNENCYPATLIYGPGNQVYVGGALADDALLLRYSADHVLQDAQLWGGNGYDQIHDFAVLDTTVWGVGYHEVGKRAPAPGDTYQAPIYDGLTLTYDRGVLLGAQKAHDIMNDDTRFTSMDLIEVKEAWIAGHGGLGQNDQIHSQAEGTGFYINGQIGYPTPLEDMPCGSSALDIDYATVTTPFDLSYIRGFMFSEDIYLAGINWQNPPHVPDVKLVADTTSGPAPLTVNFDASGSFVINGSIAGFAWTFDAFNQFDYPHGTGLTPTTSHTFNQPGMYMVSVQVTSDDGSTMTDAVFITVN